MRLLLWTNSEWNARGERQFLCGAFCVSSSTTLGPPNGRWTGAPFPVELRSRTGSRTWAQIPLDLSRHLREGCPTHHAPHSYQATFLPSKWMSITSPAPSSHLGLPNVSAVGTVAIHLGAEWRTWLRSVPISFVLKTKASFLQGKWEGGPVGVGDRAHTSSPGASSLHLGYEVLEWDSQDPLSL